MAEPRASCSLAPAIEHLFHVLHRGIQDEIGFDMPFCGGYRADFGYHNCRWNLEHGIGGNANSYSLQRRNDQGGSDFYGSALDLCLGNSANPTQPAAVARMRKYTMRLRRAVLNNDPRLMALREFCGSLNGSTRSGLDTGGGGQPYEIGQYFDSSHNWHIHLSIYRKWCNNWDALSGIAAVILGHDVGASPGKDHYHLHGTFAADVSQWQGVPVDDSYPRPWLIFRLSDATNVDDRFNQNWDWAVNSDLNGFTVYAVFRPGEGQATVDTIKNAINARPDVSDNFVVEIDVESWGGSIRGNHSTQINWMVNHLAHWIGDRRRVSVYGNWSDLNAIYPGRPGWLHLRIADWGARDPHRDQQFGWQYTDGSKNSPIFHNWPRSSAPFGNCDHNHWGTTPVQTARHYGIKQTVTTAPPDPGPDPGPVVDPPAFPAGGPAGTRVDITGIEGPLGCGTYRAFIFDRGGEHRIGEIEPVTTLTWGRVRDDISAAQLVTAGFGPDCCELMSHIHSMRHELVLLRDGVRVWEGPITKVAWAADHVEIDAQDVMYYLKRRIMRGGYDDRYQYHKAQDGTVHIINNMKTVVERAVLLTRNGLVRDSQDGSVLHLSDLNVLRFLTRFDRDDDAMQSRRVLPMQKTVWEEIEDLSSNSGLDYTVVGRRIMYWDTHNAIGRLPMWDDTTFLADPIITEYGAGLATFAVVSDSQGNFKSAGGYDDFYGFVELLSTSYTSHQPGLDSNTLLQDKKAANDAEQKFREARSNFLRHSGLTHQEAVNLANWETERNTPGVQPDRQKWLDAHIAPLRDRANKKKGFLTAMESARTDWQNAEQKWGNDKARWQEYMKAMRRQALNNLHGRMPAPITLRIPDGSQLNPDLDLGINRLVPGIWVPLRSTATCKDLTNWQKLDKVDVSVSPDQGEQITVTLHPPSDQGREPVDVTPTSGAFGSQ